MIFDEEKMAQEDMDFKKELEIYRRPPIEHRSDKQIK
jgi:hypothetical protein